jgi:hypothetical protein
MAMVKRSRRSFLRHAARIAAVGAGGLIGMSASSAKACAVWCDYQYTDNTMGDPCQFRRVYYCTSACDGTVFSYCPSTSRGQGFCLSRNVC